MRKGNVFALVSRADYTFASTVYSASMRRGGGVGSGVHLFRFRLFRSPVRDHEQRRGGCANRFVHKKAFAIHHIVFRSVRKPEQGNRLTEATLLEVNHWNSNDVPVVGSIKEFLAVAAPSRVVTAAEGNLCTAAAPGAKGRTIISTEPDSFDGTAIQPPSGDNLGSSSSTAGPIKKGFPSISDCP